MCKAQGLHERPANKLHINLNTCVFLLRLSSDNEHEINKRTSNFQAFLLLILQKHSWATIILAADMKIVQTSEEFKQRVIF